MLRRGEAYSSAQMGEEMSRMNWPEQWEYVAAERQARVRREMELIQLMRQLPRRTPLWQRWTARLLVYGGGQLTKWGTALSETPCQPQPDKRLAV